MISIMKPRQWCVHNLLSKLPTHLFTYPYVFQKTYIFPLVQEYLILTYLNIVCILITGSINKTNFLSNIVTLKLVVCWHYL
jgi:hypothetical protein